MIEAIYIEHTEWKKIMEQRKRMCEPQKGEEDFMRLWRKMELDRLGGLESVGGMMGGSIF